VEHNRICDLFGIRYPILQGGMLWLAGYELASAVSNAGALGILSPYAGMSEEGNPQDNLRLQIQKIRQQTDQPFGVNIPLDLPASGLLIDVLLQENVKIVVTAAGSAQLYTEVLRSAGILVAHVISSNHQARLAESCGVQAVIAEGYEAGGRLGRNEIPLLSLIPQIVDVVSLPIIAAGGIADGRGMTAALALGAEGAQLGTRFIASEECLAHPDYKQAIVDAQDSDVIVRREKGNASRILKPKSLSEKSNLFRNRSLSRRAQLEGDLAGGVAYAGSSVGLIQSILPAAVIIQNLMEDYAAAAASTDRD
jgi:enoyl-[acyl-carrier protein] reductase II